MMVILSEVTLLSKFPEMQFYFNIPCNAIYWKGTIDKEIQLVCQTNNDFVIFLLAVKMVVDKKISHLSLQSLCRTEG